jgi:hypothetical protein
LKSIHQNLSQVIKKRNIVIASVLKPVNDTRMFEKMAQSLADTGHYDIHILGYPSRTITPHPHIYFYSSQPFRRLSPYRLLIPYFSFVKAKQLEPDIVIITTHELLLFAWLLKMTRGCKIVYDVQENYLRNILYLSTFPWIFRPFMAIYVRLKEIISTSFIDHFILSDVGYQDELTFTKKKRVVIENKVKKSSVQKAHPFKSSDPHIKLLFSGTLAKSTGVFTAIELAKKLHELDSRIKLKIIGHCLKEDVWQKIKSSIKELPFVEVVGGDQLVPHEMIMESIGQSHFGIIAYPPNPSTQNTMPTKLFEYIGAHLPILLINHTLWEDYCKIYPAAIRFQPHEYDAADLLSRMVTTSFYATAPGENILWEGEARKLIALIARLNANQE